MSVWILSLYCTVHFALNIEMVHVSRYYSYVANGMTLLPGLRLISSVTGATDMDEAEALAWENDVIDIYSNSWGPEDDGVQVSGPGELLQMTLETSIREVGLISYSGGSRGVSKVSIETPF